MREQFDKIGDFNKAMMISENKTFGALPSPAESELSGNMIAEELREYIQAMKDYNGIEVADGLIDIYYLVVGAMRRHGLSAPKAEELFNEVHASNMSKECLSEADAIKTVENYKKLGTCCVYVQNSRGNYVIKRADGKVLKPEGYFKPNLIPILNK